MDALLWTLVLCCAAVVAVNATCSENEFACERRNGDSCLPLRWVCDGDNDCVDHSDESVCGSPRTCPDGFFSCQSGRCIPDNWVCDGANDCRDDGTDEQNCGRTTPPETTISTAQQGNCSEEQFACQSNRRPDGCIPLHFVCDGDSSDCVDGSDESQCGAVRTCPDLWHACASGRCVPESLVCDGGHDCPDGSDESQCNTSSSTPSTAHCAADEFACQSNRRSSGCIPRSWVCDGDHRDCVDDSDEQNCAQRQCAADEFACSSHRRPNGCIPLTWVCDGDSTDCVDGEDERNCGSPRPCPSDHFACDSGRCVPNGWVCDGTNDCHDSGSDERNCHTSTTTASPSPTAHCAADEFACQSNRRSSGCIPRSWVCDGDHRDCVDDSDEQNCTQRQCAADEFACASNRRSSGCIPLRWVCDGDSSDCVDGSDERNCGSPRPCPSDHFACDSGRCVPNDWVCDGTNDCHDSGSDERNCHTSTTTASPSPTAHCAADEFACQSNRRSSGCIPRSWVCDGDHRDCVDDSDEQNCTQRQCAADEFACASNRRSSGCIPLRWVCDGDSSDCVDGSDERNCGSPRPCPSDHFACDSGRCVPNDWVCDGTNDCHDSGSDERNCHTSTTTASPSPTAHCAADEFACQSPRRSSGCIPRSWVCDGDYRDCVDDSDEQNCAQHRCAADEFACRSPRRLNGCIPRSWVCDGDRGDCFDDSDELNCGTNATVSTPSPVTPTSAPATGCSAEQFACASRRWRGGCVPLAAVCDARADCDDGSDEAHCGAARACPERWFACASGRCLPPAMVCDGRVQCPDAGDETHCGNPAGPVAVRLTPERGETVEEARGGAVKVELPSWLATDQDAHFALSLAPMLRARNSRDKLDAQMAVLRLFRDLARN